MLKFVSVTIIMVSALLTGCASITDGTSQTIIFNLEPQSAVCEVSRDGDGIIGNVTARNNTLTVSKDNDDLIVKCSAPGFRNKTVRMVSKTQTAGVVGGAFIDLGITDMLTGAMWKYQGSITIALDKAS